MFFPLSFREKGWLYIISAEDCIFSYPLWEEVQNIAYCFGNTRFSLSLCEEVQNIAYCPGNTRFPLSLCEEVQNIPYCPGNTRFSLSPGGRGSR